MKENKIILKIQELMVSNKDFSDFFFEFMNILFSKETTREDLKDIYFDVDWGDLHLTYGESVWHLKRIIEVLLDR